MSNDIATGTAHVDGLATLAGLAGGTYTDLVIDDGSDAVRVTARDGALVVERDEDAPATAHICGDCQIRYAPECDACPNCGSDERWHETE